MTSYLRKKVIELSNALIKQLESAAPYYDIIAKEACLELKVSDGLNS